MTQLIMTVDDLEAQLGETIVDSGWITVTQDMINAFAEATRDHQYIHVDPAACQGGNGFMGLSCTVAHGKLTSSLAVGAMVQSIALQGHQFINRSDSTGYKLPVPVDYQVRVYGGIVQIKHGRLGIRMTIELFVDRRIGEDCEEERAATVEINVLARSIGS